MCLPRAWGPSISTGFPFVPRVYLCTHTPVLGLWKACVGVLGMCSLIVCCCFSGPPGKRDSEGCCTPGKIPKSVGKQEPGAVERQEGEGS